MYFRIDHFQKLHHRGGEFDFYQSKWKSTLLPNQYYCINNPYSTSSNKKLSNVTAWGNVFFMPKHSPIFSLPPSLSHFPYNNNVRDIEGDNDEPLVVQFALLRPNGSSSVVLTSHQDRYHRHRALTSTIGSLPVANSLDSKLCLLNWYSGSAVFFGSILVWAFYYVASGDCLERSVISGGRGRHIEAATHTKVLKHARKHNKYLWLLPCTAFKAHSQYQ